MEIALLIIGIIASLLLVVIFIMLLLMKNGGTERMLETLRSDDAASQKELRADIHNDVQSSFSNLSGMLNENIHNISKMQSQNHNEFVARIIQKLDDKDRKDTDQQQAFSTTLSNQQAALGNSVNQQLQVLEARLKSLEQNNEQKLDAMRQTMMNQLANIQTDNNKKLDEIRATVDEKLQDTLEKKMNDSFKLVSERLEQVYKGLGEMQTIATSVGDLKKVLSNVKNRGILGEIQLGAIISDILTVDQYEENAVTIPGSTTRVEFAIKLPGANDGEHIMLPIDSKFPGDTYAALQDAYAEGNAEAIENAKKSLVTVIKSCAKDIRDKYVAPPHTTQFGIMFLPFEGLYAEVVNLGLVEVLQHEYNVNVTGPSTMAAMLNSLQMGFKTLAIQKRSAEVWKVLSEVKSEFGKFEDALLATQKHIKKVDEDLDKLLTTRTRAINRKLRSVEIDTSDGTDSDVIGELT